MIEVKSAVRRKGLPLRKSNFALRPAGTGEFPVFESNYAARRKSQFPRRDVWDYERLPEGFRIAAKQEMVDDLLVLQLQRGQMTGKREDHMDVASRELFLSK